MMLLFHLLIGQMLKEKYSHIFWTPCAAHCIDLILEDIFKEINMLKEAHKKSLRITSYIYNRSGLVTMMRKFTKKELLRPAKTRFATAFITMSRLYEVRTQLREMFTSEEWVRSKWEKEIEGRQISGYLLGTELWKSIIFSIKVAEPLVNVLKLVDGEQKAAMGYIYEAMDRAKERIAANFNNRTELYKKVFKLIDARWDNQLHQPLHAAGHYLNPIFFYKDDFDPQGEIFDGLMFCISKMYSNEKDRDEITKNLEQYKHEEGLFGRTWAKKNRTTKSPGNIVAFFLK